MVPGVGRTKRGGSQVPRAIRSSTIYLIAAISLFAGACAELRVDYQTPLFMDSGDITHERVDTWIGPWVEFSVSDMRAPEQIKFSRPEDDAQVYPQESVYLEERDYAYPLAKALEMLLSDRDGPSDFSPKSADLCIRRYDYIRRVIEDSVIQYEIRAQYGFRAITTEPCEGEHEFFYATWSAGYAGGSVEERAKSEALSSFIDQVLREYLKVSRKSALELQPINLAIAGTREDWIPEAYDNQWFFDPVALQNYQTVHSAIGRMLAQQLVPELNINSLALEAPPAQPLMPTLVVEPVYLGIVPEPAYLAVVGLGEWVAVAHMRVRLVWPNGAVLLDRELDGGCVPTPVLRCTSYRQVESIARILRKDVPFLLGYAKRQPPEPPQTSLPPEQPLPEAPSMEPTK